MLDQRSPRCELADIEAEQIANIGVGKFKESPLIAFEIDRQGEWQRCDRFMAETVQQFDDDIGIAVGLGPHTIFAVNQMALVVVSFKN